MTQGKTTLLDGEDHEWAQAYSWNAVEIRGKWYANRGGKHPSTGRKTTIYLHRLIAGAQKGEEVDHINGNSLDNRRGNLRIVTHKQNQQNVPGGHGKAGVRGVTICKKSGRFIAQAKVDGHHLTFGRFDTVEEAAVAAEQGRLRYMTHSDPEARGITILKESGVEYAA